MGAPTHHLTVTPDTTDTDLAAPAGPPSVPKRELYKIPEAMILLSMGRSAIYEQIKARRLRSVRQGTARLIPAIAIREYVALLLRESEDAYDQPA